MAQYAIAYAPNLSGGQPSGTQKTGSFYVGNLIQGKTWNQVVPQTTVNTVYYASPLANVNNAAPYIIAIPKSGGSPDQPQFFYSQTGGAFFQSDAAFVSTCDYILKGYTAAGAVATPGNGANPAGCASVGACQSALTAVGWFQSYGFNPPA
jgi:hypothetical protein